MRLHVGWAINIIPYYSRDSCAWLGIGRLTKKPKETHSRQSTAVGTCMRVDGTRVRSRTRA